MNGHDILVFVAGAAGGVGVCQWPNKTVVVLCAAVMVIALVVAGNLG